jgi:hypothetical protein
VGQDRGVADLAGQGDGALADRHAVAGAGGEHVQLRLVAERQGQQPAVAGRLQHGDRLRGGVLGGGPVTGPPGHPGQPAQVRPERPLVAQRPAQPDRFALGGDRGRGGPDRVALDGIPLQQVGELGRDEPLPVPKHQPIVRGGLPVGAGTGRVPGRRRPVPDDRIRVASLGRVVQDAGQVSVLPPDQRVERPPVQRHPACHRHRVGDRPAGELVPERHRGRRHRQQAVLLGRGQGGQPARQERVDQPPLHRGRDHGQLLQRILGRRVEAAHPG